MLKENRWIAGMVMFIFAMLLASGCGKDDKTGGGTTEFDQAALLKNMSDNVIIPAYEGAADQSSLLADAVAAFTSSPDAAKLEAAQAQFKLAYKAWVHCEPFNFGPAESTVMLQNTINYWPTKPALIDAELAAATEISGTYIDALGAEKKGFPALGYLLYNFENGNEAVLSAFTSDGSERRKAYTNALCENIVAKLTMVKDEWKNSYAATFKANTGTELNTSLSLLLNNLVIALETSKNKRIGIPIGRKDNFTTGPVDPGAVELPYSPLAQEMLLENATAMENIFRGKGAQDGPGFDDYVAALKVQNGNTTLEETIKTEFGNYRSDAGSIASPLQTTIANDAASMEALWVQSKKLLVLLKVDLASNLGILITFSDNDGD